MNAARKDFVAISDEVDAPDEERDDDKIDAWAFGSRKRSFCYLLIDVGKFKQYYDQYGLFDYWINFICKFISGKEKYAFINSIIYVGVGMKLTLSCSNDRRLISFYRQ